MFLRQRHFLWKDAKKADVAAKSLRLTAEDAKALGVVEGILSEHELGKEKFYRRLGRLLEHELGRLLVDPDLIGKRYERFRRIGRRELMS